MEGFAGMLEGFSSLISAFTGTDYTLLSNCAY
jgi:hypothetical protein